MVLMCCLTAERDAIVVVFQQLLFRQEIASHKVMGNIIVDFYDERLTTVAADRTMMEASVRREDRKNYVDMIAAVLILQGYLDSL